ncbi:HAMP domain-containing sensor histidine kinase [Paenibacillus dakarensis]|uniref:HAMP domain-containing sensor histidine kinase n=1 Tax=Paenibacillus dakarensis TaxID=1527293 RepID=UPI0006D52E65|nr:HAMP domain-containing sensor histidine kinase [Paenibacillus dakarensis]
MKWWKNRRKRIRFRNSLTSRYLLIISIAMIFMPIMFPLASLFYWFVNNVVFNYREEIPEKYSNGTVIEQMWHKEAVSLDGKSPEGINHRLLELREEYPETSMFWVDGNSRTRLKLPNDLNVPTQWRIGDTVQFMKESVNSDPFTTVAFIGGREDKGQGFMVMQLERSYIRKSEQTGNETAIYSLIVLVISLMFILISWLFFVRIRRRLLHLRDAMTTPGKSGIPAQVLVRKPDEIGQLEEAYNHMVIQLESGRKREKEEEQLRKSLIANLSHDLRTPLTIIRSHIFSMRQEPLSDTGQESLALMETKIGDVSGLIDNLLSYSLLTSGKAELNPEPVDVLRLVRESAAAWYPLWEKEGFEVDIELQDEPVIWEIDVLWFKRILDNLFQNIIRHAKSGHYMGLHTKQMPGNGIALVVSDKGPGMEGEASGKGAGIGLAVVDFLTKEMGIDYIIHSSPSGTSITLSLESPENLNGF